MMGQLKRNSNLSQPRTHRMLTKTEIIIDSQLNAEDRNQLNILLQTCFLGIDFDNGPHATIRSILRFGNTIVAHAAASVRQVDLRTSRVELAVLGLVCVDQRQRGSQLGYQVIQALHNSLRMPFLLNCGRGLVPYYERIGYKEISSSASYLRNGMVVIDQDPVLLYGNGTFVSTEMRNGPIHMGTDF